MEFVSLFVIGVIGTNKLDNKFYSVYNLNMYCME